MSQRSMEPIVAAVITVNPDVEGNGYTLIAEPEDSFHIRNWDEVHMAEPLKSGGSLTLQLKLHEGYEASIESLSIGSTHAEACRNPRTLDTGDKFYLDTPFKIASGNSGTAMLTVVNDGTNRYRGKPWYFIIWRGLGADERPIDPKIYNNGGSGDGRPPRR